MDEAWEDVRSAVNRAHGMYWDGCHKIYLAMDAEEKTNMIEIGYEHHKPDFEKLKTWYDESCFLRFVSAVSTNHDNPNAGFDDLIPQGFDEEEEFDD